MIENYIVSYVILPHGITDLTKSKKQELPLLLLVYCFSFSICLLLHDLVNHGHIILFLISSIIHFTLDFTYILIPLNISIIMALITVSIPMILLYCNMLRLAKLFILCYMVPFHVPLHYTRIKLKRKDIPPIILCTIFFGIYGPSKLKLIEDENVEGFDSIMLCGLVVGHVIWNLL